MSYNDIMQSVIVRLIVRLIITIWFGYGVYDSWFSTKYLSEEYRELTIRNHPFLHEWYLSKAHLWLYRIVTSTLLIVSILGLLFHPS
jgi:hypothetical protein